MEYAFEADKPYDLSPREFFNRPDVEHLIDALTAEKHLVIFCGSGVTFDETKTNWKELARTVFRNIADRDSRIINEVEIDKLCTHLPPLELASIAREHLARTSTDSLRHSEVLNNIIRAKLYSITNWDRGRTVYSLVAPSKARAEKGHKTSIITTNFETGIETALLKKWGELRRKSENNCGVYYLNKKGCQVELKKTCQKSYDPLVKLIYVHGRIAIDESVKGIVAFSEDDYAAVRSRVEKFLKSQFRHNNVFVIGSSLSDPPLINALKKSAPPDIKFPCKMSLHEEEKTPQHYVLMPIRDLGETQGSPFMKSTAEAFGRHYSKRVERLGARLILSDFYGQLPQVLQEAALRTEGGREGEGAKAVEPRHRKYHDRLLDWASEWKQRTIRSNKGHEFELSDAYSKSLYDALTLAKIDITEIFKKMEDPRLIFSENLKLEVWIRVATGPNKRSLRLIGSSAGVISDYSNPRFARLSLNTGYSVVRAYQDASPRIDHHPEDQARIEITRTPTDPRWLTFLSVPIFLKGNWMLPVGVVVLASTDRERETGISPSESRLIACTTKIMRRLDKDALRPYPTYPEEKTAAEKKRRAKLNKLPHHPSR